MAAGAEMVSAEHCRLERWSACAQQPGAYATRPADPSPIEPAAFADLVLPASTLAELRTLVRLVADPAAGAALGVVAPAGAILFGPPGVGKTLIARAVAGESHRPVLAFSGASLTSPWTGDERTARPRRVPAGACGRAVHPLPRRTRRDRPVAVRWPPRGRIRGERCRTADQPGLQELEGVGGAAAGVFVIGATNFLETWIRRSALA